MIRVSLRGSFPAPVRRSLERAGLVAGEAGEIVLVWYDGRELREDSIDGTDLTSLASRDEPIVALVPRADLVESALKAGATEVLTSLPPPAELIARMVALARYADRWRHRVRGGQRRLEKASDDLIRARGLLDRILEVTPNPVVVADLRGRIVRVNPAGEQFLGYASKDALEHLHVTDIYADVGDARHVHAEIRSAENGLATIPEVRLRTRGGEHVPVRLYAGELYDGQGEPIATFGLIQDDRELLAMRERLEDAGERLILAEQRASAIGAASSVAHELNQPLTAVMAALEILELRRDLPTDVTPRLSRAYAQLERMARLIRSLGESQGRPTSRGLAGFLDQP